MKALDVAAQLGVARLLNADDMLLLVVPDKLNVMTFVYELRAQLTGCSLHSASPPLSSAHSQTSSSPPTSTDWLSNLCPLTATERQAVESRYSAAQRAHGDDASSLAQTGKQLLACVGQSSELAADCLQPSPTTDGADSALLMTRQQLLNPFDSDSDSEAVSAATALNDNTVITQRSLTAAGDSRLGEDGASTSEHSAQCPSTCQHGAQCSLSEHGAQCSSSDHGAQCSLSEHGAQCSSTCQHGAQCSSTGSRRQCSRREQLRERARLLLDEARRAAVTSQAALSDCDDERRGRLRDRARKLIAESRAGGVTQVITVHSRKPITQSLSGEMLGSALQQRHNVSTLTHTDQQSPDEPVASYAEVEMELLERSLARLDERAAGVEWSLRRVMDSQRQSGADDAQQRLIQEWFALVDERAELVRRIEQLNAVAHEQDLERRFELLSVELRRLMADCETSENDEECAGRERLLLAELMSIVSQRDALVQQLDRQEHDTTTTVSAHSVVDARKPGRRDSACSLQ